MQALARPVRFPYTSKTLPVIEMVQNDGLFCRHVVETLYNGANPLIRPQVDETTLRLLETSLNKSMVFSGTALLQPT